LARSYALRRGPPADWAMCSSSTERATLLSNGERIEPYEQRWVMRSAWRLPRVGAVVMTERCA